MAASPSGEVLNESEAEGLIFDRKRTKVLRWEKKCQINEKNMRRDEGIPPYSCRVLDAGRRVADPYIYFVYVSATLSTVKRTDSKRISPFFVY